jgi:hypothetical protein
MADELQEITVDAIKKSSALKKYPLQTGNRNGFMRFTPIDGEIGIGDTQFLDDAVELQLPQGGLSFADGMNYENNDLGIFRGAMVSGIDAESMESLKQSASDFFNNIGDPATRKKGISNIIAMTGMQVAKANARAAPNPNTRAFFKGPNIREFTFAFKMIPTSPDEADTIRTIIKTFRKHMYPERMPKDGSLRIGFYYPAMFHIEVFLGDIESVVTPKYKPCFLKSMSTVFNSSTGAILAERGKRFSFAEADMNLTFSEEVTLAQDDIEDGY